MMQQPINQQPTPISVKPDERILVVKRSEIMPEGPWHGIKQVDFDQYLEIIHKNMRFLWRSEMENNPFYKQIIPYMVFIHNNRYFLMQRKATASETRLQNKYSLGIGGHIRMEDMSSASIIDWAKREFHEEVTYQGSITVKPLGIINDDTNPVGQVHIGFVLLLQGNSDAIAVRSELKSGQLIDLEGCKERFGAMESWSQMVFEVLTQNKQTP
jgi:predicted NUDIX family phosphoesterase